MPKIDTADLGRLCKAVESSRTKLTAFRGERTEAVRKVAGSHWSSETSRRQRPINLLWNYQQVTTRSLIPKCPRFLLSTFSQRDEPTVAKMQTWMNQEVERMALAAVLRRWVLDALYGFAFLKVAIADPADAALAGYNRRAGDVMAVNVDLDDLVIDMYARQFEEVSYIGHFYRVPIDAVKDSKAFNGPARRKLEPQAFRLFNNTGDERTRVLGLSYSNGPVDEYYEYVELCELYLPQERKILVIPCDPSGLPTASLGVLREAEWVGPDCGPYHELRFGDVPGNLPPIGPLMQLIDNDAAVNKIYRKLISQAFRQKTVLPVRGGNEDDMKRLTSTDDGFAFRCDNPQDVREVSVGGPHQMNLQFGDHLRGVFDRQAGGLALLSGASPMSKTASQDKMLNENATAGMQDMAETTTGGVSAAGRAMAWFFWHNPHLEMRMKIDLPNNVGMAVPSRVTPADRQRGRWADLDLRVDPYSLVFQSPRERLSSLMQVIQTIYMPLAQMWNAAGVKLDGPKLFKLVAEYMDQPQLHNLLTLEEPPAEATAAGAGDGDGPGAPAQTTRTYVRQSVPGRTEQGDRTDMRNRLMGMNQGGNPATTRNMPPGVMGAA